MKKFTYLLNGSLVHKTFDNVKDVLADAFGNQTDFHYKLIFNIDYSVAEVSRGDKKINIMAFIPGEGYCYFFEELREAIGKTDERTKLL